MSKREWDASDALVAALDSDYWHVVSAVLGTADMAAICHKLARKSGWWAEYDAMPADMRKHFIAGKLALAHSEVSEALEAFRKSRSDDHLPNRHGIEVELADAVIRIMDLAGALGLDLAGAMVEKLAYNQRRADHKPENRAKEGGKAL